MSLRQKFRPSVFGSPTILGYDSGRCDGGAGVLRVTGFREALHLAMYNGRTLRLAHYLTKLEVEYGRINWSIRGLSEVRRLCGERAWTR